MSSEAKKPPSDANETGWRPSPDLEPLNRLVVSLEQDLLGIFRGARPLATLLDEATLPDLLARIDENPHQAVALTRIKSSHAMTPRHGINVLILARAWAVTAHRLGGKLFPFSVAALLHDLGHWRPASLVYEFGHFTKEQFRQMQAHVALEDEALRGLDPDILRWIRQHHERPDGRGYPDGDRNPHVLAQVIGIADVFDGLTTPRRFRPAYSPHEAMALMLRWSGHRFDARLLNSFLGFMGLYPPGSYVRTEEGQGITLPSEGEGTAVLMLTNADGDSLAEPTHRVVATAEIRGEGRQWYNVRLPDAWKNLRPDLLGLPRAYH